MVPIRFSNLIFLSLLASFHFFPLGVWAEVVADASQAGPSLSPLPLCVDSPKTIAQIKATMTANSKTRHKYDGYRDALRSDSDVQILARLAYAETMAANCSGVNSQVASRIVETIGNRVKIKGGINHTRDVVFERQQFASTLNNYDFSPKYPNAKSRYLEFLCPTDAKLWSEIYNKAQAVLTDGPKELSSDTVHYYLFMHHPEWSKLPDDWKFREDATHTTPQIQQCVRFYHNPNWN